MQLLLLLCLQLSYISQAHLPLGWHLMIEFWTTGYSLLPFSELSAWPKIPALCHLNFLFSTLNDFGRSVLNEDRGNAGYLWMYLCSSSVYNR